jgi:hypothetical protein
MNDHGDGRRNQESSVVFSLDSLRAIAQADRATPVRPSALPSFAGTGLTGIGATAPTPGPVVMPIVRPVLAPAPSNLPLMLMMGILLLTTIGLAAYVVIDPRPRVVVTQVAAPEPSAAAVSVEADDVELVPDRSARAPAIAEPTASAEQPSTDAAPVVQRRARTAARPPATERTRAPVVAAGKQDATARRGDVSLECVLDPKLPGCGGKASAPPPTVETRKPAIVDPSLPETLSTTALRNGIAGVKGIAKTCGSKHGGAVGEKVKIKLSIVGATGAVESTAAEGAHRGTALGNCVAAALKKASFPHFRKPVIGLEYTITL